MSFVSESRRWWESKFAAWVRARNPPSDAKHLTQKNVFIFPTKEGGFFTLLMLLLLLTAINYQNSLIYLFLFLLGALFVFSIIYCFKNMAGLSLSLVDAGECFVGESVNFNLTLKAGPGQNCESLLFFVAGEPLKKLDVADYEIASLMLSRETHERGRLALGRIRLETVYPLGLIRAWTWLEFKKEALVFPAPVQGERSLSASIQGDEEEGGVVIKGEEELSGIRDYVHGDTMSRIAWKHYAAKGELFVKEFETASSSTLWLNYSDYPGGTKEQRLSYLCHDVLEYAAKGLSYGLVLPTTTIEPSLGEEHKLTCLRALALA